MAVIRHLGALLLGPKPRVRYTVHAGLRKTGLLPSSMISRCSAPAPEMWTSVSVWLLSS